MAELQQVLYVSRARAGLSDIDLRSILGTSRMLNRRRDVTGILVFTGEFFLQMLEGAPTNLAPLLRTIGADLRHEEIKVIRDSSVRHRSYGEWAMGWAQNLGMNDMIAGAHAASAVPADVVAALLARLLRSKRSAEGGSDSDLTPL